MLFFSKYFLVVKKIKEIKNCVQVIKQCKKILVIQESIKTIQISCLLFSNRTTMKIKRENFILYFMENFHGSLSYKEYFCFYRYLRAHSREASWVGCSPGPPICVGVSNFFVFDQQCNGKMHYIFLEHHLKAPCSNPFSSPKKQGNEYREKNSNH